VLSLDKVNVKNMLRLQHFNALKCESGLTFSEIYVIINIERRGRYYIIYRQAGKLEAGKLEVLSQAAPYTISKLDLNNQKGVRINRTTQAGTSRNICDRRYPAAGTRKRLIRL